MISQEYINTVLGAACDSFGYPVTNAYFYRDVVPQEITDDMLNAKCAELIAEQQVPADPYQAAEQWVHKFFTASQLLQFKVWWDAYPHEATPKLGTISVWQTGITRIAHDGGKVFEDAPYTFDEIASEVLSIPTN